MEHTESFRKHKQNTEEELILFSCKCFLSLKVHFVKEPSTMNF